MSSHHRTPNRSYHRRGSDHFDSHEDVYNERDDLFLRKVLAARAEAGNGIQQQPQGRDYLREQEEFMRSLHETPPQVPPDLRALQSTSSHDNPSTCSSSRQSSRVADLNFDDPTTRKVVMGRASQYLTSEDEESSQGSEDDQRPQPHHCHLQHELDQNNHSAYSSQRRQSLRSSLRDFSDRTNTTRVSASEPQELERKCLSLHTPRTTNQDPRARPSEPGAYAATPTSPPSRATSSPGAFAVTPITASMSLRTSDEEEGEWETLPPEFLTNNDSSRREEASAESGADPGVFTADVSLRENIPDEPKSRLKSTTCVFAILISIIVIVTAIVVGLLLGLNKENDQEPEPALATTLTKPEAMDAFIMSLPLDSMTVIEDQPTSPQTQAFDWLVEDINFPSYPLWRLQQRFALATIYFSLQGPQWESTSTPNVRHTWLHYDKSECDWLPHANPAKACDDKTGKYQHFELQHIDLTHKDEMGRSDDVQIPPEVSLLTSLESLSFKDLALPPNTTVSDLLPLTIQHLSQLGTIDLLNLQVAGTLPSELGLLDTVFKLDMSGNQIKGPIPSELGQLDQLEALHMEGNHLRGTLPSEIGLWTNLELLHLQDNGLSGKLPTEIGRMASLTYWEAADNALTGVVPSELGMLTGLRVLRWDGNQMTGSLPNEVHALLELTKFGLLGNQISGRVPKELCSIRPEPRMYLNCSFIVCCYNIGLDI